MHLLVHASSAMTLSLMIPHLNRVHNALWVHKYELADENWKLKKDGIIDEHGFCLNTSSCDHAMRHPYIMEGSAKVDSTAFSLPYFGNVSEEIANATVTLDHLGKRPVYDRSTMGDKIWVDPLTGETSAAARSERCIFSHSDSLYEVWYAYFSLFDCHLGLC